MLEIIINSNTLLNEISNMSTWGGLDVNHFVAGGTIAAAFGAFYAGFEARKSSNMALQMHRESEEKRDKEKEKDKIDKQLNFLKGIKSELYILYIHYDILKEELEKMLKDNKVLYKKSESRKYLKFYNKNISELVNISNIEIVKDIIEIDSNIDLLSDSLLLAQEQVREIEKLEYDKIQSNEAKRSSNVFKNINNGNKKILLKKHWINVINSLSSILEDIPDFEMKINRYIEKITGKKPESDYSKNSIKKENSSTE